MKIAINISEKFTASIFRVQYQTALVILADRTSSCEFHAVSVLLPVRDYATAVQLRLIDLHGDLAVRGASLPAWIDAAVTGRQL